MTKIIRTGTALVVAATLQFGVAAGQERRSSTERFKPFRFKAVDGGTTTLSDVLGKATLVVFFFPTCQYCAVALPEIQKLHDTYKDSGLVVVGINVVPAQDRLIPKWRTEHGFTIPILLGGFAAQRDYSLSMTPTHYLLDAGGNVLSRHEGFNRGDEKQLEQQIREALGANVSAGSTSPSPLWRSGHILSMTAVAMTTMNTINQPAAKPPRSSR